MTLFVLTETSAGYALLKAKDKKLLKRDDLAKEAGTAEGIMGMLKLKKFRKFESANSALEEAAALTEGKVCLHKFLYRIALLGDREPLRVGEGRCGVLAMMR